MALLALVGLGAVLIGVFVVLPNLGECARRCAAACRGQASRVLCDQRCRFGCFYGFGRQTAKELAAGRLELDAVQVGDRRVIAPEISLPLPRLAQAAVAFRAPQAAPQKAEPDSVDLRPEFRRRGLRINDQGDTGTCMAQALTSAMEYELMPTLRANPTLARRVGAGTARVELSRKHAYFESLHSAGLCQRKQEGSWVLQAASSIKLKGTFLEKRWPWAPWNPMDPRWKTCEEAANGGVPPAAALRQRHFFIGDFRYLPPIGIKAVARNPAHLEGILASGHPIVLATFLVRESFDPAWHNGGHVTLPEAITARPRGGHYVLLLGYDRKRKRFRFANSWGRRFGTRGFGTLEYAFVERYGIEGLFVREMRVRPPQP